MFKDKRVLITGGSSGLGKALARRLLDGGAAVTLLARDRDRLSAAAAALGAPGRVSLQSCDVSDPASVASAFSAIAQEAGPVHTLINSAGVLHEGTFDQLPLEEYRRTLDINLFGVLHCCRAALEHFDQLGEGRIVNVASVAGLMSVYGYGPYCASKHALVGLTGVMRMELKPRNVRVHIVCPPEFESPMVEELEKGRSSVNRTLAHGIPPMSLDAVADQIMAGVKAERYEIVTGGMARAAVVASRWAPGLLRRDMDRRIRAALAKVPA